MARSRPRRAFLGMCRPRSGSATHREAVLVAEGSVWVANRGDGTISRVDPATNRAIATIGGGAIPTRLTADSGAVWVATAEGIQADRPGH